MFDILQELLQSHPFLMSPTFETQDCQWCETNMIKSAVSQIRRIVEQSLGRLKVPQVVLISIKPIPRSISLRKLKTKIKQKQHPLLLIC